MGKDEETDFIAAPLSGIFASLQQAAGNLAR